MRTLRAADDEAALDGLLALCLRLERHRQVHEHALAEALRQPDVPIRVMSGALTHTHTQNDAHISST